MNHLMAQIARFASEIEGAAVASSLLLTFAGAAVSVFSKLGVTWLMRLHRPSIALFYKGDHSETNRARQDQTIEIIQASSDTSEDASRFMAWKTTDRAFQAKFKSESSEIARGRVLIRITEALDFRKAQQSRARISSWASNLLTIAQFVIGGVLASSFVQESLSPKWVGSLGILVLVASLFKQQFHPEIDASEARRKAAQATKLIRSSEDRLAVLDARIASGQDHSDAMIKLMTDITDGLNSIETSDAITTQPKRSK